MEYKTEGIVLKAVDYKENDKIITLFTPTRGKMTVCIRGVRKANAKLSFAAQPFCFAEYVLAERSNRYTVVGAYLHDGFYSLRSDIVKYYAACTVMEICNIVALEDDESESLFIATATALKEISLSNQDESEIVITFCLSALNVAGYTIDLDGCGICGNKIGKKTYFDFSAGHFTCNDCAQGVRASGETYQVLRMCSGLDFLENCIVGGKKRALRLLRAYFSEKLDEEFPCFAEFIRLYEEK